MALGISFYFSWKLTLVALSFVPFLILGGLLEMSVVIGGEEKAKKEFEASSMLKTIFLMFFYENRVATHSG